MIFRTTQAEPPSPKKGGGVCVAQIALRNYNFRDIF